MASDFKWPSTNIVVAVTDMSVEPLLIPPVGRGALMGRAQAREQGLRSPNANRNPAFSSSAVAISGGRVARSGGGP